MAELRQAVLFLVDGMRPDGMVQADTPTLDALLAGGAHTLNAQTTMPSLTLPCHASLLLGVSPARHGIITNVWTPQAQPLPGLFDVLHQAGLITAFFHNWEALRDLSQPGALNASFMIKDTTGDVTPDREVAALAAGWLGANPFNFAFVYLGATDIVGHAYGWMSDRYLASISHADQCIATVLDALPEGCTVLVTSDHGGHEQTHGTDCAEDMTIPLIMNGPTISRASTLTGPVSIADIAPTITRLLDVRAPDEWIGTPLVEHAPATQSG